MPKKFQRHPEDKTGSIDKALTLLDVLAVEPYAFTVPEIVAKTGFNRTTVYRTLQILLKRDYVHLDKEREKYQVGHGVYHVGTIYLHNNHYQDKVMEILAEISGLTKESVGMAVREGDKIMSLLEVEIHQPMKFNDFPGKYFPPNKGSYGKCIMAYQSPETIHRILDGQVFEKTCYNTMTTKEELLAEYARIREQGYVTSIDELHVDVVGTGVPIFDRSGQVNAVVAVAFFKEEGWQDKLERFTMLLLSYQEKIEKCMP
jgi:DNA-binding IclR family transcriptional regulator